MAKQKIQNSYFSVEGGLTRAKVMLTRQALHKQQEQCNDVDAQAE